AARSHHAQRPLPGSPLCGRAAAPGRSNRSRQRPLLTRCLDVTAVRRAPAGARTRCTAAPTPARLPDGGRLSMVSRDPSLITRLRRLAPVIALTFSGCTCAGSSSSSPAQPAVVVAAATATRPPAEAPPTAVPAVPAAAVNAKRAACLRAIDALAGSTDDSGALASPEARLLADQIPDLVTCGAIRKNTDVPCHTLLATERSREIDCLSMRSKYDELRTYPKGRGFLFDDLKYAECQ